MRELDYFDQWCSGEGTRLNAVLVNIFARDRRSHKYFKLKLLNNDKQVIAQKNPRNCLILTLIWTSENAATMSRKTFGARASLHER